jgi:hypothetical protein
VSRSGEDVRVIEGVDSRGDSGELSWSTPIRFVWRVTLGLEEEREGGKMDVSRRDLTAERVMVKEPYASLGFVAKVEGVECEIIERTLVLECVEDMDSRDCGRLCIRARGEVGGIFKSFCSRVYDKRELCGLADMVMVKQKPG